MIITFLVSATILFSVKVNLIMLIKKEVETINIFDFPPAYTNLASVLLKIQHQPTVFLRKCFIKT